MVAYQQPNIDEKSIHRCAHLLLLKNARKTSKITLNHITNDFYQNDENVDWTLYIKEIDEKSCDVKFSSNNAYIRFRTNDSKFLKLHTTDDADPLFELNVELTNGVVAEMCSFRTTKFKLEIKLRKCIKKKNWDVVHRSETGNRVVCEPRPCEDNEALASTIEKCNITVEKQSKPIEFQPVSQRETKMSDTRKTEPVVENSKPRTQQDFKQPHYGKTGLVNLGNTCYMNATIQCLANTYDLRNYFLEDQHELNRTNPLGLRGLLAQAYSMFMRKLWHGSYDRISPAKIRDLISEKYSQFSGFEQHDAQEFMNALLSLLHEDLNRIEKRPYFEPIDGNGWDDKRLADESWRLFLSRDDSVIVDNFYGQFKSKLTCPECNKISIIFEAFNSLLVPIPGLKIRLETIVFLLDAKNVFKYICNISKTGQIKEIVDELKSELNLNHSEFAVFLVSNGVRLKDLSYETSIDSVDWTGENRLIINEVLGLRQTEQVIQLQVEQLGHSSLFKRFKCEKCGLDGNQNKLKRCCKCFRVAYCNVECQKNDWQDHKNICGSQNFDAIGVPFVITVPRLLINETEFMRLVKNFSRDFIEFENTANKDEEYLQLEVEIKSEKKHFKNCAQFIEFVRASDRDSSSYSLKLFWTQKCQDFTKQLTIKPHELLTKQFSKSIMNRTENNCTLDDCLKLFTQPEKLTSDNPWYCPKCKKHQEAKKQIYLWKLPKYLIIILKRFQAHKVDTTSYPEWMMHGKYSYILQNRLKYEKLNTFIDFPVDNLNMSTYIGHPVSKANETNIYDLYGVTNHLGTGIQFGHYTAFARCNTNTNDANQNLPGWRSFDDSYVKDLNESKVVTPDAYVLFYRRRDQPSTCPDLPLHAENTNPIHEPDYLKLPHDDFVSKKDEESVSESSLDENCSFDADQNALEDEAPPPYTDLNDID